MAKPTLLRVVLAFLLFSVAVFAPGCQSNDTPSSPGVSSDSTSDTSTPADTTADATADTTADATTSATNKPAGSGVTAAPTTKQATKAPTTTTTKPITEVTFGGNGDKDKNGDGNVVNKPLSKVVFSPLSDTFMELVNSPDKWSKSRSYMDSIQFADHALNSKYTADQLKKGFAFFNKQDLPLVLEVGAVKDWATTGRQCFEIERKYWSSFIAQGAKIYELALDEPMKAVMRNSAFNTVENKFEYAVEQTAIFIKLVRENFPSFKIGDIEPFPSFTAEENIKWIDALQARLEKKGVKKLDFYRVDVNWVDPKTNWTELVKIQKHCKDIGLPFSMIYWASDCAGKANLMADDANWYNSIMSQADAYKKAGGAPAQHVYQSWIQGYPNNTLSETSANTFSKTFVDLYEKYLKSW